MFTRIRNAVTGRFASKKYAEKHPDITVVEQIEQRYQDFYVELEAGAGSSVTLSSGQLVTLDTQTNTLFNDSGTELFKLTPAKS